MRLYEFEAKRLLAKHGVRLPQGGTAETPASPPRPAAGARGAAPARRRVMIFSDMGGIDIEQVAEEHPEHIARAHLSTLLPLAEFKVKEMVASLGIGGSDLVRLTDVVARLGRGFTPHR